MYTFLDLTEEMVGKIDTISEHSWELCNAHGIVGAESKYFHHVF